MLILFDKVYLFFEIVLRFLMNFLRIWFHWCITWCLHCREEICWLVYDFSFSSPFLVWNSLCLSFVLNCSIFFNCFVNLLNWVEYFYKNISVNKVVDVFWDSCLFYYWLRGFDSAILSLVDVQFISRFDSSAAHFSLNPA